MDPKSQLEFWSETLKLTDDQKQKISAIVGEDTHVIAVTRARVELVLAAFADDAFSFDELSPATSVPARTARMLNRIVDIADRVTKILTPAQRTIAGERLRDRAMGKSTETPARTGQASSTLETISTTAEPLWAGGGRYWSGAYRNAASYGFSRSYATGYGGMYLF
jgi:hypothetical protein